MANLDDLFSKRDKKKKTTTKSKFSTLDANEFAKQLEVASSRVDDDLDYAQDGSANPNSNDNLDEEWKVSRRSGLLLNRSARGHLNCVPLLLAI